MPDVSASEGPNEDVAGPPFDGFEDVTTLGNKAEANAASTTNTAAASTASAASQDTADGESSSEDNDMLPNTVVSDAIQRIDVDDDNTCEYSNFRHIYLLNALGALHFFSSNFIDIEVINNLLLHLFLKLIT